ncbi:cardiolipin synthase [Ferviditalea candida]|uniref:Cardiolipin synthase n=1 Tax=Ferviditalea candida TaxID=3108399 RepID=A0ABU5ZEA6_9BACL|nr:cardiolipin synthase [Paenibacillaceae bacterium T2]
MSGDLINIINVYSILSLFNLVLAATIIFFERRNIAATWAWLMVLLFLPGIGFMLYLFLGQKLKLRRLQKAKETALLDIHDITHEQIRILESGALAFHDRHMEPYRDIIHMNLRAAHSVFTQDNKISLFVDGKDKFDALFESILAAKDHIHLLYYIFKPDELGAKVVQALTKKAKEGIDVKVLYDEVGSSWLSRRFFRELISAGGEVASFFSSRIPFFNVHINYRNHRKFAIIDGKIGYIGGFNIGNEYLGLNRKFGFWRDTHLKMEGTAVHGLQRQFLTDWSLAAAKPLPHEARYFPEITPDGYAGVQIVSSGPDSDLEHLKNGFLKMIYAAKETISIQSPYFIPDESFLDALKIAALSGVSVHIMLPSLTDHKLVKWASQAYLGELLRAGVKCFLYEKGFLHAKTMVVDRRIGLVGTANVDLRSFRLNFETDAFIYDSGVAEQLYRQFVEDLYECKELTLPEFSSRPLSVRMKESLSRLLSPLL